MDPEHRFPAGRAISHEVFVGVRAILLDIDGTLVDSNEYHVRAWDEAFRRCGHMVPVHAICQQIGKGADQLIPALRSGATAGEQEAIAGAHDEIFQGRYLQKVQGFTDASEFVARLHDAGMKVVLASSARRSEVDHYIHLLDIEDCLEASTCADDVSQSKPAGDLFVAALSKVSPVSASEAVVIGDTPYDVIAAAKCSIPALGVLSGGFSESLLRSAGAVAVYSGVSEVLEVIGPDRENEMPE
jgi:phosphoglycolate phosphatase-like HAD superfamily hydrolase